MSTKRDKFSFKDKNFMNLAFKLARVRKGLTGKNPSVGCVIVKKDQIISIGQTGINGRPHAESNAIKNSLQNLKGSKMYVTLEPCNHYGKTPPCTSKIIKSRINEVIYSIDDIDKKVKGKSLNILKKNNIKVKKGLLKIDGKKLYDSYLINRKKKLPYVTGKIAISHNNLIYSKGNQRITDNDSNKLTHYMRYKNDAIMVSSKTVNIDNPKLNCRLKGYEKFSPKRIILDKNLEMKQSSYIFKSANKKNTIIFYNSMNISKIKTFKRKGITLIKSKLNKKSLFDLKKILKILYKHGINNLLVEGGDKVTKSFIDNRQFDQFYLFKSPKKISLGEKYQTFSSLDILIKKYSIKFKIRSKIDKDNITIYKR